MHFALLLPLMLSGPAFGSKTGEPTSALTADLQQPSLKTLCLDADRILIGEVLTSRIDKVGAVEYTVASLVVQEVLRGNPAASMEVRTRATIAGQSDPLASPGNGLVPGYSLAVFLDPTGTLLAGGMFFVQAGHAWRNKTPGVFLNPRSDRDWIENIDPTQDYDVIPLKEMRDAADHGDRTRWWRRLERKNKKKNKKKKKNKSD